MKIEKTKEFEDWINKEPEKSRFQIEARLALIEEHNYFGHHKPLGDGLLELKWKNGRRVYYGFRKHNNEIVLVLLGGNKNAQSKDINKAKKILKRENS